MPSFLFGFLVALLIFGFNTPFLSKFQITYNTQTSWAEFFTAIGTLLAVIVALFGDWIRNKIFPSKLRIVDKWQNVQNTQGQTRLLVRNIGWGSAYEVEVYVTKILDNGQERAGFLPVPLIWTHTPGTETKRDLHPKQFGYYLDLCRVEDVKNPTSAKIPLIFGAGVENYEKIRSLNTILEVTISQKSGDIIKYEVGLQWFSGQDEFVRILNIDKK